MAVVIRLQGLPASAGTLDIRHYFSRLTIPDGGVHIIGGELGEAFVVFATDEDARLALLRSGEFLKGNRTKLTLSSRNEMQSTIEMSRKRYTHSGEETSSYKWSGFGSSGTGGLGSISSTLAENLVAAMQHGINRNVFHPSDIGSSDMNNYGSRVDPMMSGTMSAMALSSPQNIPGTPSMSALYGMSSRAISDSLDKFNGSGAMDPFDNSVYPTQRREQGAFNSDDVYLRLQGMPYSARELQVREFFHGLQVEAVNLKTDHRGLNNGVGFVRFATPWDAAEGLKRHKKYMGQRFVEVYRATKLEWISEGTGLFTEDRRYDQNRDNRGRSPREEKHFRSRTRSRSPRRHRSRSRSPHDQDYWVQLKNIPYGTSKRDVRNFFDKMNLTGPRYGQEEGLYGGFNTGNSNFGSHSGGGFGSRFDSGYQGHLGMSNGMAVVKACNLPFKFSVDEILDFFYGYRVIPESVTVRYNEKGLPAGDAVITFETIDEAMAAVRELNEKPIGKRNVKLSLL
ncbi:RNA-binding protein 12B-like isoform X2 [Scyliorhinus torazame]|uniref:RNA-binding protein 12B-like isoform X2 n=1 Tax=Scyliorhinus torazame TaxID=75743 RepID=UPI003B5C7385